MRSPGFLSPEFMGRRSVLGVCAAGAAALLAGCAPSDTIRYRLTAEVETPEGVRTGQSVIQVAWTKPGPIAKAVLGGLAGSGFQVTGDAIAVDLPRGETLFVLLRSPASEDWAGFASNQVGGGEVRPVPRIDPHVPGMDNYPYFVRFRDISDPGTIEQVDPDDLATSFGEGYRLKALTFQRTSEPVTEGIKHRLTADFWHRWGARQQDEVNKGPANENPYFKTLASKFNKNDFLVEGS